MRTFVKAQLIKLFASFGYEFIRTKYNVYHLNTPILPYVLGGYLANKSDKNFSFVQIGANDGIQHDPIHDLVLQHPEWKGILVEPIPNVFKSLVANYKNNLNLKFEQCAISDEGGIISLYCTSTDTDFESMRSSIAKDNVILGSCKTKKLIRKLDVPSITLQTLFNKYAISTLDLLLIDIEGYDFFVIQQLLKTSVRPAIIQFEHSLMTKQQFCVCWDNLIKAGYKVSIVGIDTIAIYAKSH